MVQSGIASFHRSRPHPEPLLFSLSGSSVGVRLNEKESSLFVGRVKRLMGCSQGKRMILYSFFLFVDFIIEF